jgi:hypothetical protein
MKPKPKPDGRTKRPKQSRQTVETPLQKRKREDGRPRGSYKIYPFEQTRLGFFLKYEVPVVYDLILSLTPPRERKAPPVDVIRAVCAASPDPSLLKPKFFRWLERYESSGVLCRRPKLPSVARMAFYYNIRSRKLARSVNEMAARGGAASAPGNDFNSIGQ